MDLAWPSAQGVSGPNTEGGPAYLPDVQDVMGLPVHLIRVEDQIAVSPVEEAIPLPFHRNQLQVLNSPDLGTRGDTVTQRGGVLFREFHLNGTGQCLTEHKLGWGANSHPKYPLPLWVPSALKAHRIA